MHLSAARSVQNARHVPCSGAHCAAARQALHVDSANALAEERDREVRNILQSIADLGQIMKDLSVLVIDQGTILDRIDYNMEQARRPAPVTLANERCLSWQAQASRARSSACALGVPRQQGLAHHCVGLLCRWRPRSTRV